MKALAILGPAACLLAAAPAIAQPAAPVLARIHAAGTLACAVLSEPADYTLDDTHGPLLDFGRDICRAVAAALLGDGQKLRMAYLPDEQHGFAALRAGQADLLIGASRHPGAGAFAGVGFGRPVFFDGQGFLIDRAAHASGLADLAGKQVCYIATTRADAGLQAGLAARGIAYKPFPFEEMGEMEAALVTGNCAAMTGDVSALADARAQFHARAADFVILPQRITLDPVAPAWPRDDPQFGRIVDWTVSALLAAEQDGVRQADAASARGGNRALLELDRAAAPALGLPAGWALRAVATVGNYGELYRRDLGDGSPLRLPRGANALWSQGGMMYPLPAR